MKRALQKGVELFIILLENRRKSSSVYAENKAKLRGSDYARAWRQGLLVISKEEHADMLNQVRSALSTRESTEGSGGERAPIPPQDKYVTTAPLLHQKSQLLSLYARKLPPEMLFRMAIASMPMTGETLDWHAPRLAPRTSRYVAVDETETKRTTSKLFDAQHAKRPEI